MIKLQIDNKCYKKENKRKLIKFFSDGQKKIRNDNINSIGMFDSKENYQQICSIFLNILKHEDENSATKESEQSKQEQNSCSSTLRNKHNKNLIIKNPKLFSPSFMTQDRNLVVKKKSFEYFIKAFEHHSNQQRFRCQKKQTIINSVINKFKSQSKIATVNEECDTKKSRFRKNFKRQQKKEMKKLKIQTIYDDSSNFQKFYENFYAGDEKDYLLMLQYRHLKTIYGHRGFTHSQSIYSAIYNVIYDKNGKIIISADENGLIKIWSSETGINLQTLKGHSQSIEHLHITQCNSYLISCGKDGIRIWNLKTQNCMAVFLSKSKIIAVSSYQNLSTRQLSICFTIQNHLYIVTEWEFQNREGIKIIQRIIIILEKNLNQYLELIIARGLQYCYQSRRIYFDRFIMGELVFFDKIIFTSTNDFHNIQHKTVALKPHSHKILDIKWNKKQSNIFITGSQDGTCKIWEMINNNTKQEPKKLLKILQTLAPIQEKRGKRRKEFYCNCIAWTCDFNYILCSFGELNQNIGMRQNNYQGEVIIFSMENKKVLHTFKDKFFFKLGIINVLQPHPYLERIVLICESGGRIIIVDIINCQILNIFQEWGMYIGVPEATLQVIQAKFNPNGDNFAVSTEYGTISIYGYGIKHFYRLSFTEQFSINDFDSEAALLYDDIIICNSKNQFYSRPLNTRNIRDTLVQNKINKKISQSSTSSIILAGIVQQKNSDKYKVKQSYLQMLQEHFKEYERLEKNYITYREENQRQYEADLRFLNRIKKEKLKEYFVTKVFEISKLMITHDYYYQQYQNYSGIINNNNVTSTLSKEYQQQPEQTQQCLKASNKPINFSSVKQNKKKQCTIINNNNSMYNFHKNPQLKQYENNKIKDNHSDEEYFFGTRQKQINSNKAHPQQKEIKEIQKGIKDSSLKRLSEISLENLQKECYQINSDETVRVINQSLKKGMISQKNGFLNDISSKYICYYYMKQQQQSQEAIPNIKSQKVRILKGLQCKRCKKQQAARQCQTCQGEYFCENCEIYRGKQYQTNRFRCFECILNQNIYSEKEKKVNKELLKKELIMEEIYVPQIGDEVYFFFQGYEQFLMKHHSILSISQQNSNIRKTSFRLFQFDDNLDLRKFPLCSISQMEYQFPRRKKKQSQQQQRKKRNNKKQKNNKKYNKEEEENFLILLLRLEIKQLKYNFQVFYIPQHQESSFIVRKEIVHYIFEHNLINGVKMFSSSSHNLQQQPQKKYQIVQKSPCDKNFPESIWKWFKVEAFKNNGEKNKKYDGVTIKKFLISPNSTSGVPYQNRINIWDINEFVPKIPYPEGIPIDDIKVILINLLRLREARAELFYHFYNDIDTTLYANYEEFIEMPISIYKIERRLKLGYYRSIASLRYDICLIRKNSAKYNGKCLVTQQAKELEHILLKLIETKDLIKFLDDSNEELRQCLPYIKRSELLHSSSERQKQKEIITLNLKQKQKQVQKKINQISKKKQVIPQIRLGCTHEDTHRRTILTRSSKKKQHLNGEGQKVVVTRSRNKLLVWGER